MRRNKIRGGEEAAVKRPIQEEEKRPEGAEESTSLLVTDERDKCGRLGSF